MKRLWLIAALGTTVACAAQSGADDSSTTAPSALSSDTVADSFCGTSMFKVDSALPSHLIGQAVELDFSGRITKIGGREVGYNLLGVVTKFGDQAVEYDWVGRVSKLNGEAVSYEWVGRVSSIGHTDVTHDLAGRISAIGDTPVSYSLLGNVSSVQNAPVDYSIGSVTDRTRRVLCLAAFVHDPPQRQ